MDHNFLASVRVWGKGSWMVLWGEAFSDCGMIKVAGASCSHARTGGGSFGGAPGGRTLPWAALVRSLAIGFPNGVTQAMLRP